MGQHYLLSCILSPLYGINYFLYITPIMTEKIVKVAEVITEISLLQIEVQWKMCCFQPLGRARQIFVVFSKSTFRIPFNLTNKISPKVLGILKWKLQGFFLISYCLQLYYFGIFMYILNLLYPWRYPRKHFFEFVLKEVAIEK